MGKTVRIKSDLDDVKALIEIISVLKDVATNRFFSAAQAKEDFSKFFELFLIYFKMLGAIQTSCPLVSNKQPGTDIVVITSEASFMSQLNSKACNAALQEYQTAGNATVICVGWRGVDKCRGLGMNVEKSFQNIDDSNRYDSAMAIRDFLIERILTGKTGKAICIYVWAKSFSLLKPRIVKLLPADELLENLGEQAGSATPTDFIQESSIDGVMKVLANIWVSSKLYEILLDTKLAEAAAQAQQLESSLDGLSKEQKTLLLSYRKASRDDLNKSMREVITASQAIKKTK